jgi:hypothetical protein
MVGLGSNAFFEWDGQANDSRIRIWNRGLSYFLKADWLIHLFQRSQRPKVGARWNFGLSKADMRSES